MKAWDMGATVTDAYYHYSKYKTQDIPIESRFGKAKPAELEQEHKLVINEILDVLSQYTTYQLIDIIKNQSPWMNNYKSYDTCEIPIEDLKAFADELLKTQSHLQDVRG